MNNEYENTIILKGGVIDLDKYNDSVQIIIEKDTIINAINLHNNPKLKIILKEGASCEFNLFDYAVDLTVQLDIESHDNSHFTLNNSFIAEKKYDLTLESKLYGNNITQNINIRGINEEEGIVKITMEGTVAGETKGSVLNEYARILNKSYMTNVIIPNLLVNTDEVEANHGVSIGKIREEELFYLMSKGIDKAHATKLIEEGFILSIMPEDVKVIIKNILMGR